MKLSAATFAFASLFACLFVTSCAHTDSDSRVKTDADDAAYKAGKMAHVAADKTEKAAKVAGEKIKGAAKSAKEGWQDSKPK